MFIPYRADVGMKRYPIANYALILLTVIIFFMQNEMSDDTLMALAFQGITPITGWIGHQFIHADLMHLLGNMLFLYVFGNAVCAKLGQWVYLGFYLFCGIAAAIGYLLFGNGGLMIGASGAINGIIGAFLIFYPLNTVSCVIIIFIRPKSFSCRSFWVILIWFMFDIFGSIFSMDNVAYGAHIGGFLAGALAASALLYTKVLHDDWGEISLLTRLKLIPAQDPYSNMPSDDDEYPSQAPASTSGNENTAATGLPEPITPFDWSSVKQKATEHDELPPLDFSFPTQTATPQQPPRMPEPINLSPVTQNKSGSAAAKGQFRKHLLDDFSMFPKTQQQQSTDRQSSSIQSTASGQSKRSQLLAAMAAAPAKEPQTISVTCPGCSKRFRVAARFAGKTARCSNCNAPLPIPICGDQSNLA